MAKARKYVRHVNLRIPSDLEQDFDDFCFHERRMGVESAQYLIALGLHAFKQGVRIDWWKPPGKNPEHEKPPQE